MYGHTLLGVHKSPDQTPAPTYSLLVEDYVDMYGSTYSFYYPRGWLEILFHMTIYRSRLIANKADILEFFWCCFVIQLIYLIFFLIIADPAWSRNLLSLKLEI